MLWLNLALAAPSPELFAWVNETEAVPQLVLAMTLGPKKKFQADSTLRFDVLREQTPVGRIRCGSLDRKTLRCRIDVHGETCPTCGTVLDMPYGDEGHAEGVRGFAGRVLAPKKTDAVVLQIPATRFGPAGLLTVRGRIERAQVDLPIGPHGLRCEGHTVIQVDPDPWEGVQLVQLGMAGEQISGARTSRLIVPGAMEGASLEVSLDDALCTLKPVQTGGETGICGGIGIALHYTPLCDVMPASVPVAMTEALRIDTAERCLVNTHSYREIEEAELRNAAHQTCGGRTPGDAVDRGITAVPHTSSFPWLTPRALR